MPLRDKGRLLRAAVLADRDRRRRRRDRPAQGQPLERGRWHVLELGRDRVAGRGETIEARRIEVVGADVLVRDPSRGAVRIGIEDDRAIAERLCRVHEHPAELAAADDAEGRAGSEVRPLARFGARHGRAGRHFRSAVIARAASLWRRRYVSSLVRSAASPVASIATANSAALTAPAPPMAKVATGIPRGIWTIE